MAKINHEEYKFLKNLDDKWKWIARSKSGLLLAHSHKLSKRGDSWETAYSHFLAPYFFSDEKDKMFQFIQWEDEEPYNISELIEEYESEETEVKNIEWLRNEIKKLQVYTNNPTFGRFDQIRLWDVEELINQLDEPEVLSEEWIEQKSIDTHVDTLSGEVEMTFRLDDLENLLVPKQEEITEEQVMHWLNNNEFYDHATAETVLANAVDKGELGYYGTKYSVIEKPVIPKFVAEFLDGKEKYTLYELLDDEFIYDNHDELARWLYDNDEDTNKERELSLVLAQRYGYEVEVEQKYYVMNNDNRMMLVRMMDGKTITESDPFMLEDMYEGEKESHRLTEQEIKDYDPRYMAFAKPIEELE